VSRNQIIYLDRNENLYGPSPACLEALRQIGAEELASYSRDYVRGVKSLLSERLAAELSVPEKQIVLGDGSEDLLKQVVHCYLRRGEAMLCPSPSWWYYGSVASEVEGKTVTFPLKQGEQRFVYDIASILSIAQSTHPRIILLASPNNPTGNSLSVADLEKFLDEMRRGFDDSLVLLDEAYWGFQSPLNHDAVRLVSRYPNLIVLRSFSKLFALAGARIAYAVVNAQATQLTKFAERYLGFSRISERLALAALNSMPYYESISRRMQTERERYYRFFDQHDGFMCYRSDANFVLTRMTPAFIPPLKSFLTEKGIFVKFFAEERIKDVIRITIGTEEHNTILLSALDEFFAITVSVPVSE
jgi:histidinol-phosphate aminotransferase